MHRDSVRIVLSLLLLVPAFFYAGPVCAQTPNPIKIMLLGDSITYGTSSTGVVGYRRSLHQQLVAAGYSVDFVGSQTDGEPPDFDRNHEGHSGWRADEIRDSITEWLNSTPPDVVLLHIGTNDINQSQSAASTRDEIAAILDRIETYEIVNGVEIWVVLARIINRSDPSDTLGAETTLLNNLIQSLADARIAAGDRIVVVDMENALSYPGDMADSVHPEDSGYAKMADAWFAVLADILNGMIGIDLFNLDLSQSAATGDLICSYQLGLGATTAATSWHRDGSPVMVLYLPMEGGAVSALKDYSGNTITVAAQGNAAWSASAGHDGKGAFVFDGIGDDLNAGENFPTNSSYTKTAWVYRTGCGANDGCNIISGDQNPDGHALWAPDMYGNKLSAGHNGTWDSVQDSAALELNTWYFVAVTYDSSTKDMILYKNGVEIDRATVTAAVADTTISIGSFGVSNGFLWKGTIDDARVYKHVLSPQQVAAMYNAGAGNTNVTAVEETFGSSTWQCRVTPFSAIERGATLTSNTLLIRPSPDQDGDGDVDGSDLVSFAEAYAGGNGKADLNEDGFVDELDVEEFAGAFGADLL
jgi:lysophospholipase L1-like esterase